MPKLAGIGKRGRERLTRVLDQKPAVITSSVVSSALEISKQEATRILYRWNKSGWVKRIKRGVYIPVSIDSTLDYATIDSPYLVADSLYGPGYIGGFSAIKHWDLTEQIIETVYYFSLNSIKERSPVYDSIQFKIKTVKPHKFFGVKPVWVGSKKISISDPSKTMIDIFDAPKLVGGMRVVKDIFIEYIESEYCDLNKIYDYAIENGNKTVLKRLGFLSEVIGQKLIGDDYLNLFKSEISSGYSEFDTAVKGTLTNEKWKIKITKTWKKEHDRKK